MRYSLLASPDDAAAARAALAEPPSRMAGWEPPGTGDDAHDGESATTEDTEPAGEPPVEPAVAPAAAPTAE
jgi:hypothetical protein